MRIHTRVDANDFSIKASDTWCFLAVAPIWTLCLVKVSITISYRFSCVLRFGLAISRPPQGGSIRESRDAETDVPTVSYCSSPLMLSNNPTHFGPVALSSVPNLGGRVKDVA